MSFDYNHVTLIGRLAKDPESITVSDTTKAFFPLAVKRAFRKDNGSHDADFLNIVAWGKLGEICLEYLSKGKPILIDGRLQVRSYEKNQETKWVIEVIAESMKMLDSSPKNTNNDHHAQSN